jgi:sulfite dehydrogenase (quinone) subunit SoeC
MHPAYSVILFTTASGAGYGLLAWLALAGVIGWVDADPWLGFFGFGLALGLITAGLLASTAHLGRPERAWRAFSQWRTSWLSREGVLAVLTYVPAAFLAVGWVWLERILVTTGIIAALCAVATLFSTGVIYASLRTIRQWHQPLTAPIYIALGLASGAVLLNLLLRIFQEYDSWPALLALVCLAVAAALKWAYWQKIDGEAREYKIGAATGLGGLGQVRQLEPPHTGPNFVMREMGYEIGRKHAEKLRRLVLLLAFAVPMLGTLVTLVPTTAAEIGGALLAVVSMAVGLAVERWLFFAEAEHVSMLYYGREAA